MDCIGMCAISMGRILAHTKKKKKTGTKPHIFRLSAHANPISYRWAKVPTGFLIFNVLVTFQEDWIMKFKICITIVKPSVRISNFEKIRL